jgi:hypothetical protein
MFRDALARLVVLCVVVVKIPNTFTNEEYTYFLRGYCARIPATISTKYFRTYTELWFLSHKRMKNKKNESV